MNPSDTIDALMQIPGFAAYEGKAFQRILDIVLAGDKLRQTGKRIRELPYDFGVTEDVRNAREEVISVANVVALMGSPESTLVKGERPDFSITMPSGTVGAEHTRAFTGYQKGSEEQLYRDVQSLNGDADVVGKIGNLSILLTIERSAVERTPVDVMKDPVPQGFIGRGDVRNIIAELRTLVENGYFQGRVGAGSEAIATADAPTLAKFRATADVAEAMYADQIGVHAAVRMWKPGRLSLFAECVERIRDKTIKAAKYPSMPEWLIVQVVAPPEVFAYDLAEHEMKSLGPFQKVFVLYWHIDGQPYLANWTLVADGTIVADIPELATIEEPYDEALHEWADAVEKVLEPRRIHAWIKAGSDDDVPKLTSSPLGVQWYRK